MPTGRLIQCVMNSDCLLLLVEFDLNQGALDVRFLAARFEKGKKAVHDTMEQRHRYWQEGLQTGHAELLSFQSRAAAGDMQPRLGKQMDCQSCVSFCLKMLQLAIVRHTIMIMDASLWPYNRVWTVM